MSGDPLGVRTRDPILKRDVLYTRDPILKRDVLYLLS